MLEYEVTIIGAGPAGISAAIYLKRANINFCIIEKDTPGGQINKTSIVENYPGIKNITGPELAYRFYEQLESLKIDYYYNEVIEIKQEKDYKIIVMNNQTIKTKSVILALGREPRHLDNTNEKEFIGKGVSFCALCDGALYQNQTVAIVGGGNSAFEEAIYLSKICKKVIILNRSTSFKADQVLVDEVKKIKNIKIRNNTEIVSFEGNEKSLTHLQINENNKIKKLKVQGCFIFIGYIPATSFIKNLDILEKNGYIKTDANRRTEKKNIYAAGDIIEKDTYQIVTAASDGAIAATSCIRDLNKKNSILKLNNHGWGIFLFLLFVLIILLILFIIAGRLSNI